MSESSSEINNLPINKAFQQGQAVQPVSQQFQMNAQHEVRSHLNQGVPSGGNNITIQVHEKPNNPNFGSMAPGPGPGPGQTQNTNVSHEYKPFTNVGVQSSNIQTIAQTNPIQGQSQGQGQGQGQVGGALNAHEFQNMMNAIQNPIGGMGGGGGGNMNLPSRDIPTSNLQQSTDIQSHPNYVPGQMRNSIEEGTGHGTGQGQEDFIEKHQQFLKRKELKESKSRQMESIFETLMDQVHIPLILGVLYFLFQLPFFNERLHSQLPVLFVKESKLSVYGIIVKAVLFALSYLGIHQFISYMSIQ